MMLTLVPTPIGNLEDITLRALRVLREADIIACEDTRTSGILLRHYNIHKPLTSFHLHNENDKLPMLLAKLREGAKVAVISDAGTPGISDPGWILLRRAMDEGLPADVLPGPNAVIPAVLLSGMSPQPFAFMGFPPEKRAERVRLLEAVKDFAGTLCFYLSPHKAEKDIDDMLQVFGDREAALVREISKVYQESLRGTLSVIRGRVREGVKGELVLVVDGGKAAADDSWKEEVPAMLESGMSMKDTVSEVAEKHGLPKNDVKKYIISLRQRQKDIA
ncbi:MAG: 16S rRNA (cytidine(1402)-2'-O)-methyltransferase [Synergistaceae bacterium]|nr:16S rRNA (cytidine(1402)-2'-O)-methyltransferase [Synergistaceae bacterium]